MDFKIELGATELKQLDHLHSKLGDVKFVPECVKIEVKSKQNWRSEWEDAEFRVSLSARA